MIRCPKPYEETTPDGKKRCRTCGAVFENYVPYTGHRVADPKSVEKTFPDQTDKPE